MIPNWFPIDQIPELGIYSDFSLLTEGGFGQLYSARRDSNSIQDRVVVKRLQPMRCSDPQNRDLFLHEAKFLKKLRHPQIPKFFDGFFSDQECFFIMEKVEGIDLLKISNNAKASGVTLTAALILHTGKLACEVLSYLHEFKDASGENNPIVHCDIKPDNFLLRKEGLPILIDFSVAQFLHHPSKQVGGTPRFMAPERLGGQKLSTGMDLFSLNLSLFYLLTRRTLPTAGTWAHLLGFYLDNHHLSTIREQNFPAPLEAFFLKNLQLKPEGRAPDAKALQAEIQALFPALGLKYDPESLREEISRLSQIS